jgi:alkylation response protein AidB-like acyl-CoA dehydrogenase
MDFRDTPDEAAFRDEVRTWLAENLTSEFAPLTGGRGVDRDAYWDLALTWERKLGEAGWIGLSWPKAYGGRGASFAEQVIFSTEYAKADAPIRIGFFGEGLLGPTLVDYGTEEQKRRFLPPILSATELWCQGYSEPEAGSDLAAVRCRAERRGDVYVVNGQKCWQSYAQDMDYLWTLVRTGAPQSRGRGLSLLIIDKRAPGVTVNPLPTLDGDQLNEVFFDGVSVPVEQRIGAEDGAWAIMAEALADERHIQFPPGRVRRDLDEVIAWARAHGLAGDPRVRAALADLAVRAAEVEACGLRVLDAMLRGQSGAVEAAANKVLHTVVCQEIARAALDFGGPAALVTGERVELLWRQSLWETIGGGTSEVMRGVVARQGLGLGGRS